MIITQLTPEMERRLREPLPGSAIEAARDFGIDLTLLIAPLRLTPEQRVRKLQQASARYEDAGPNSRSRPKKKGER